MEMQLVHVDAADRFLTQLRGVTDPEQKRRIVGETFIRVFEAEADEIGKVDFITQGTTYTDVIESATGHGTTVKIKTHHNVGGLPKELTFVLVEPLRYLFKDEVWQVGLGLGLPERWCTVAVPGPGLRSGSSARSRAERVGDIQAADWIVMDEVKKAKLYHELWQSFAVLTDTRSVGVMAHDADAARVGEHGERLPELVVELRLLDLVHDDPVGRLQHGDALRRHLADDADGEARAGERLAVDHLVRQAEREADLPHFVLEQVAQRLDELERQLLRQAADVVVRLDLRRRAVARRALDDVGVGRALRDEVDLADLVGLRLEDADERLADDAALLLRVGDAA